MKNAPSDDLIVEIEKELGYKLPESYIWLMKRHNGGIMGIGRKKIYSICGELGSQFMIDEWEYTPIGVAICDCLSAGHDMIFLDYRKCGKQGEPEVVHIDQECDYKITHLADNFESFICGLVDENIFNDEIEDE